MQGAGSNLPPVITAVSNTLPISGSAVWVTARATDDVAVASATLAYSTGAAATATNTVFLETMATNAIKPWTGTGCDNAWTVTGTSFEQRGGANYGSGNTNGLEFKGGTTNLADSMITTAQGINASGTSGTLSFSLQSSGLSGTAGWTLQLTPGSGFTQRRGTTSWRVPGIHASHAAGPGESAELQPASLS